MNILKIKIYSEGGQGVKSMVDRVEEDFNTNPKFNSFFITSLVKYDSIVKGGVVETNILVSTKRILSPFFDKADLCIVLKKDLKPKISAEETLHFEDFTKEKHKEIQDILHQRISEFFNA